MPSLRVASCDHDRVLRCALRLCLHRRSKKSKYTTNNKKREPCLMKTGLFHLEVHQRKILLLKANVDYLSEKKATLIGNDIDIVKTEKSASNISLHPFLSLHISESCRQDNK